MVRACMVVQEFRAELKSTKNVILRLGLDHNDGQFFRAMEWLMFFLGHHCRQWFFNGFDKVGPSPLNVFLGVQPLEPMVFRWFSKF